LALVHQMMVNSQAFSTDNAVAVCFHAQKVKQKQSVMLRA